jgi:tRNA(fMet)-specific endonuclease VapC
VRNGQQKDKLKGGDEDVHCIDSDFAVAILKGDVRAGKLLRNLEADGDIFISSISVFELTYVTGPISKKNEKAVFDLLDTLNILYLDDTAALLAGKIGRGLAKKGKMIHPMDLLIGATALSNEMPLVTNNKKHFSRIDGLELVSW